MKEVLKLPGSGRFGYLLANQGTSIISCFLFQCSYSMSMNFTLHVVLTLFRELLARIVIGVYGPSCLSEGRQRTRSLLLCLNPVPENHGAATRNMWTANWIFQNS
jgi:hypothetical protein